MGDSAFWAMLFRPLVFPSEDHNHGALYGALLPFLTGGPVVHKGAAAWSDAEIAPLAGDGSRASAAVEAARVLLRHNGLGASAARRCCLRLRWGLLLSAAHDLRGTPSITPCEATLVKTAARELAARASRQAEEDTALLVAGGGNPSAAEALSLEDLAAIEKFANDVRQYADNASQSAAGSFLPPDLTLELQAPGAVSWPLFGRLLPTDTDALAGTARRPPLLRPMALTLVPDGVRDYNAAAVAMRHAERLCTLLSCQSGQVKHTVLMRLALLQHLFISVLPVPLPPNSPDRATHCFWQAQEMRYETQLDLLLLLSLLCRHYATAALSLKADRALDTARVLTAACIAALADAVMRRVACDLPSPASLHYSGQAQGPVEPFGFRMRRFAAEAESLPLTSPEMAVAMTKARTRLL